MKNARILLFVVAAFTLSSCGNPARGKIQHTLVAWLNKPADAGEFIASIESLKAQIKEIKTLEVGSAIVGGRGGVPVDKIQPPTSETFDVGFIMTFDNEADFKSYENNPIHVDIKTKKLVPLSRVIEINTFLAK